MPGLTFPEPLPPFVQINPGERITDVPLYIDRQRKGAAMGGKTGKLAEEKLQQLYTILKKKK